jgi:hypothetical protein
MRHQSTMVTQSLPKFISLVNHDGNQHPISVYVTNIVMIFKWEDNSVNKLRLTNMLNAHRQVSTETA